MYAPAPFPEAEGMIDEDLFGLMDQLGIGAGAAADGLEALGGADMVIPPLNLSSGPSMSDGTATSGGSAATGDFNFKTGGGFADKIGTALPLIVVAGLALWLMKKSR